MQQPKFYYHTIHLVVSNKDRPVTLNAQLPANITKIVGIRAIHSAGLNVYDDLSLIRNGYPSFTDSSIGWFYIEFNNRQYAFGNLDVGYNPSKALPVKEGVYLPVDIAIESASLVTGIYNNVFDPDHYMLNNKFYPWLSAAVKILPRWMPYIISLNLQCEKRND